MNHTYNCNKCTVNHHYFNCHVLTGLVELGQYM